MPRLILHIGQYKTGSTSLQSVCVQNQEAFRRHGILYPRSVAKKGSHGLLTSPLKRELETGRRYDPRPLLAEIAASGCDTVIISNEGLSGARMDDMQPRVVRHMWNRIREIFDGWDTEVVYYYRRQDDAVESRIVQTVKGRRGEVSLDPQAYMTAQSALDYDFFHRQVERAFPGAVIHPRCFDRGLLHGGDVVRDFFRVIRLPTAAEPAEISSVNISPSGMQVGLTLALNTLRDAGYDTEALRAEVRSYCIDAEAPKAVVLDLAQREAIMRFYAPSNEAFLERVVPAAEREAVRRYLTGPSRDARPNTGVDAVDFARFLVETGGELSLVQP